MKTEKKLREEISLLMIAMAENGVYLRRMERIGNSREINGLLHARAEILKSIAHRQGLLIERLTELVEYRDEEAA